MKNIHEAANELFHAAKGYIESIDQEVYKKNVAFLKLKQAIESYNEIQCNNIIEKIKEAWRPEPAETKQKTFPIDVKKLREKFEEYADTKSFKCPLDSSYDGSDVEENKLFYNGMQLAADWFINELKLKQ